MAHFERIRDVISGPFSPEIIQQRTTAGWQLVWVRVGGVNCPIRSLRPRGLLAKIFPMVFVYLGRLPAAGG